MTMVYLPGVVVVLLAAGLVVASRTGSAHLRSCRTDPAHDLRMRGAFEDERAS
jgi:hypothetical protein